MQDHRDLQAAAALVDDPDEKTTIMAKSKVVQNNARPAAAQQKIDSMTRKRLKVKNLQDIKIPAHMYSISQKGPLMRRVLDPNVFPASIVPTSPVKTMILLDREISHGIGSRTSLDPRHMREISFLDYDTKEKLSIVLEQYGYQGNIDDDRLSKMALDILKWIPDNAGVRLGYWQNKGSDMNHLLNLLNQFAMEENMSRSYPIQLTTFIDYQREMEEKIFSCNAHDDRKVLSGSDSLIFSPLLKLGTIREKYWKGDEGTHSFPESVEVWAEEGDGKSVQDNCDVWHLIKHVGAAFANSSSSLI